MCCELSAQYVLPYNLNYKAQTHFDMFSFLGNLAETEPTCDDENNTGLCTDSFKWACDYCDYFQADCQKLCGQC